jgi:rfaE bifunctional protein nucleotidyltransferase chain/domain
LHEGGVGTGSSKALPLDLLGLALESRRRLGQRIVFTNGCFDVLHAGHVQYLQEARQQGDLMVVGINSDASVRDLKGPSRPINAVEARTAVLAGLSAVDYVVVFDAATPLDLIKAVKPDVLVKGADYRADDVVGGDFVKSYGGRVHLAALREGVSSSGILRKLEAA